MKITWTQLRWIVFFSVNLQAKACNFTNKGPHRRYFHANAAKFFWTPILYKRQKQPSRGVLRKKCSKIIQKIYRRTPTLKCDFNNWSHTWVWEFSCKFAAYFQRTACEKTREWILLKNNISGSNKRAKF